MTTLRLIVVTALAGCIDPTTTGTGPVAGSNGSDGSAAHGSGVPGAVIDVPLVGLYGIMYTAPLEVGGVTFQVQIDTGSSPLGLAAAACGSACSGVSPLYVPGATATDEHQMFGGTYADMSGWSAEVYHDDVALGASPAAGVDFGAITSQTMFFPAGDVLQGIMGLGPDDLIGPPLSSWKDALFGGGIAPEMAFRLCETHGDLWLGGHDDTAMAVPPVFTPMSAMTAAQPFYAVDVTAIAIGGTPVTTTDLGPTLIDTGTNFTYVSPDVASAVLAAVTASPGYAAVFGAQPLSETQCVTTTATRAQVDARLPPLSIQFPDGNGGTTPAVALAPSQSYLYDDGGGTWCVDVLDNSGFGLTIIGDTMQEAFVTVFDLANERIGFAPEAGCGTETLVRERAFQAAKPGMPWWSNNPWFREPRRHR